MTDTASLETTKPQRHGSHPKSGGGAETRQRRETIPPPAMPGPDRPPGVRRGDRVSRAGPDPGRGLRPDRLHRLLRRPDRVAEQGCSSACAPRSGHGRTCSPLCGLTPCSTNGPLDARDRGTTRKYGARLGNAAQLAADLRAEAGTYPLNLYGGVRAVLAVALGHAQDLRCPVRVVWCKRSGWPW